MDANAVAVLDSEESGILVYRLIGCLKDQDAPMLGVIVTHTRAVKNPKGVVLDCSELEVNNHGAKAISTLKQELREIPLYLVGASLKLTDALNLFGLKSLFGFSASVREAIRELSRAA